MESARPRGGAWSRKLWLLVVVLTLAGLVGIPIAYGGLLFSPGTAYDFNRCSGLGLTPPNHVETFSTSFAAQIFVFLASISLLVLYSVGLILIVAVAGFVLFWKRSLVGPLLLFIANLLSIVLFGCFGWLTQGDPRNQLWAQVGLLVGASPVIAAGLVVWPLLKGETAWKRAREWIAVMSVLGAVAVAPVGLYVVGVASEVRAVLATPPQSVPCGSTPAAGLTAAAKTL